MLCVIGNIDTRDNNSNRYSMCEKDSLYFSVTAVSRSPLRYAYSLSKIFERRRKVKVIREIENGEKEPDLCQEFGLVNSSF